MSWQKKWSGHGRTADYGPVRKQTSELRTKSCHLILSIQQQQKKPKAAVVRLYIAETVRDCTMITTSDVNI